MTGTRHAVVLAVVFTFASFGLTMASQQRPYRVTDQQLKDLVKRIETHRDAFHTSVKRAIDRSPIHDTPADEQIGRSVNDFAQAMDRLRDRVNDRKSDTADAEDVLRRASSIDNHIMRNQLGTPAQSDWQALRLDMNELARAYGITVNWSAASRNTSYRDADKQVEQLLKQIGEKADRFDKRLDRSFDSSRIDDRGGRDAIHQSVKDFRQTADRLRDRIKGDEFYRLDVEGVLERGLVIDGFVRRHQVDAQAEQNWLSLRGDLDGLARAYNVTWNWSSPRYTPAESSAGFRHRLTGTYQLESSLGDDPRLAAELAARAAPADQRQRTYESLLTRLEAPELIAIERNENGVTMASTRGRRVTFAADGRDHAERWSAERTMNTRATLDGERLVVETTGNRGSDFTVTFDPIKLILVGTTFRG